MIHFKTGEVCSKKQGFREAPSFPFELGEARGGIARIIGIEELPFAGFRLSGFMRCRGNVCAFLDQAAQVLRQLGEIGPLVGERLRPLHTDRTVAGHCEMCRDGGQRIDMRELAYDAAVDHGDVLQKEKIAGEKRTRRFVEDGQIAIGVHRRPGVQ